MKKTVCTALTVAAIVLGQEAPIKSHLPLSLNATETLKRNSETGNMEVTDVTTIPHYEFFDSTYNQRVYLATHSHSDVVTDLAYYSMNGEWIEDIRRANPPRSEHVSKEAFDASTNTVIYSHDSKSGTGQSTANTSEDKTTYYNEDGFIDSVEFTYHFSQYLGSYEINQKSIYHYDPNVQGKLIKISAQRDDTLYEENYTYVDTADIVKIIIDKKYTFGDSTWYDVRNPIEKYCRYLDTTTIVYKSEDGSIDSHTQRKYNHNRSVYEETNFNINSGELHALKTYTYTTEGHLKQERLYKPNIDGIVELQEEKNYDYSWKPVALIENSLETHKTIGHFSILKNDLQLTLAQSNTSGKLIIINASGQHLIEQEITESVTTLSLTNLSKGIYIAIFRDNANTLNSFRFTR